MNKHVLRLATAFATVAVLPALTMTGLAHASVDGSAATSGSATADEVTVRGATEVVGGGTWSYGVDSTDVFSAYDNRKVTHSTAVRSWGSTVSSGKVAKGKIAWASKGKAPSGNTSYWNIH